MAAQTIKSADGTIYENAHYRFIVNMFPKFEGHTMLVPKAHITAITTESAEALLARQELLVAATSLLGRAFPDCGIELFLQTGPGSASSVTHLHWHLVPASPTDELRSFEKLGHFYTTKPDEEKVVLFPKTITMSPESLLAFLTTI